MKQNVSHHSHFLLLTV